MGNDENKKKVLVRTRESAIITIAEIDTLKGISSRGGATVTEQLRLLFTGETLGFGNRADETRIIIPKHKYRACVVAGVQPGRGEVILGNVEGGFPQRWLWLPANDPDMPDERPREPEDIWEWEPPGLIPDLAYSDGPHIMEVWRGAWEAIDKAQVAANRNRVDDIETHSLYVRLKVAAGLALLDGSDSVRESDWELSALVMRISKRTRRMVEGYLAQKASDANKAQAKAEGVRRYIADKTAQVQENTDIAGRVLSIIEDGEWWRAGAISQKLSKSQNERLDVVLNALVQAGKIESAMRKRGQESTPLQLVHS